MSKQKQDKIFELYDTLTIYRAKGKVRRYIAELCKAKQVTVDKNWIHLRYIPKHVNDRELDKITEFLNELHIMQEILKLKEALNNLVKEVKGCELDDKQREAVKQAELLLNNK